jgi:hypothetical protein
MRIPGTAWVHWMSAAALSFAVAGCDSCRETEAPPVPARPAEAATPPSGSASAQPAPDLPIEVKLLEPGDEPRRDLRYKFHLDRVEIVWMELRMAMSMQVGAAAQPETQTPPMRLRTRITPKELTPDGSLKYDFKLESVEVLAEADASAEVVASVQAQMLPLAGMAGSAEIDARGVTRHVQLAMPPGMPPPAAQSLVDNMRQTMRNIASPMPLQPVGKGARWEVAIPLANPGIKLSQTSTFTLKECKGDKGKLLVAIRQDAAEQKITLPGMNPGAVATLQSIESSGSGTMDFDLNEIAPVSNVSMASTMQMKVEEQGTTQPMKLGMKVWLKTGQN